MLDKLCRKRRWYEALGCLRKLIQFNSSYQIFNDLYPWLTQGYSSNYYILNSYHLEEVIICCRKWRDFMCKNQGLQHGEKPKDSNTYLLSRQPKIATCAGKAINLPSANTKDIWVPRSLLTNHNGSIKRWVPKYAWQALQEKEMVWSFGVLERVNSILLTQAINLQWSISKIDPRLFWIVIS